MLASRFYAGRISIMTAGIYMLTNKVNGKQYIGQSWNIEDRWYNHKVQRRQSAISGAIEKHGWDNFDKRILIVAGSQEDLDLYEIKCIELYGSVAPGGYNLTFGGSGGSYHTDDTKEKIGAAQRGKTVSEATRAKLSAARKGVPW